jgi:hypothetical protein
VEGHNHSKFEGCSPSCPGRIFSRPWERVPRGSWHVVSPDHIEPPHPSANVRTGNVKEYSTRVYRDFVESQAVDLRSAEQPDGLPVSAAKVECSATSVGWRRQLFELGILSLEVRGCTDPDSVYAYEIDCTVSRAESFFFTDATGATYAHHCELGQEQFQIHFDSDDPRLIVVETDITRCVLLQPHACALRHLMTRCVSH